MKFSVSLDRDFACKKLQYLLHSLSTKYNFYYTYIK